MFTVASCLMKFIDKIQASVIRILYSEVARNIEVYRHVIVDYECDRMRQNAVYDLRKLQNEAEEYSTERTKCLVTLADM